MPSRFLQEAWRGAVRRNALHATDGWQSNTGPAAAIEEECAAVRTNGQCTFEGARKVARRATRKLHAAGDMGPHTVLPSHCQTSWCRREEMTTIEVLSPVPQIRWRPLHVSRAHLEAPLLVALKVARFTTDMSASTAAHGNALSRSLGLRLREAPGQRTGAAMTPDELKTDGRRPAIFR